MWVTGVQTCALPISQILPARPCPHKRRNDLVTVSERGSGAGVRALDIAHEGICKDGSGNSTLFDVLVLTLSTMPHMIGLWTLGGWALDVNRC